MGNVPIGICLQLLAVAFQFYLVDGLCSGSGPVPNVCTNRLLSKSGDIRIVISAQLHESKPSKQCDSISVSGFQTAVAVQWITEKLNGFGNKSRAYIPGVAIGYDIFDDCGLTSRAIDGMLDLLPERRPLDLKHCSDNCTDVLVAGVIAMTSLEATETVSQLTPSNLPLISSVSSSGSLESKSNVFFTSSSIQTEISAILKLLIRLRWHYIGIVFSDDALGLALKEEYERQSQSIQICVAYWRTIPVNKQDGTQLIETVKAIVSLFEAEMSVKAEDEKFGVVYLGGKNGGESILQVIKEKTSNAHDLEWIMSSAVGTTSDIQILLEDIRKTNNGVFSLAFSPPNINFSELNIYLNSVLQNQGTMNYRPWIDKYRLKSVSSSTSFQPSTFSAVNSLISLVTVLKQIHTEDCNGDLEAGICPKMAASITEGRVQRLLKTWNIDLSNELKQFLPPELHDLNTTMRYSQDRYMHLDNVVDLDLNFYGSSRPSFYDVGNFTKGALFLTDDVQLVNSKSLCKEKCKNCLVKEDISFVYVPGDLLILGLFSVSGSHDDSDSAPAHEKYTCGEYREDTYSVITALSFVQAIKSLNDSLTNFNFGGIALDDCYNPLNISYLLAELFSGKRHLRDKTSGQIIDMSKVVAVVGALSSKVTQVIADQMTTLKIPVLSYGASSAALDDRVRYPFFLRTVPSDTLQVDGLIEVMVHFNFTHIGAIYYDDAYGLSGLKDFQRKAMQRKICVEYPENITEGFRKQDVDKLIKNLRRNLVDVVLFYGIDTAAKELLEVLAEDTEGSPFTFIASEAWGTNPQLISGNLGNQAKGSLVFLTDTHVHLHSKFLAYLENLTPSLEPDNPWITDFWQDRFKCSFPESYNKKYRIPCNSNHKLSKAQAKAMYDDQRGIHTMHAVFAVREGIRNTLFQICGSNLACKYLRTTAGAEMLTRAIRTSTVTSEHGNQLTPFKDDGNGYMGFTIYNIQRRSDNTFDYVQVGNYSQENKLQLRMDNLTFYDRRGYPTKKIEAGCSYKFSQCSSICPQTVEQTTTSDVTSSVTPVPASDTSIDTTVMPIILGVVIGILVIIVILLVILMLRQQKTKALIKEQSTASIASHHVSSLNIYDEPRSNDGHIGFHGRANRSFEPSSSSGIANSSNSSSTLQKDTGTPIQYTHISGLEKKGMHSQFSDSSTQSLNRRLSASLHSLRSGSGISQSSQHHAPSPLATQNKTDTMLRRHSADDILTDSNGLTYMTAKDFEMADEDISPQSNFDYLPMSDTNSNIASGSDRDSSLEPKRPKQKPIRRKLVKSNNIEMKPLPKPNVTASPNMRPKTLPGINPQNAPKANQIAFSNDKNETPVDNQDLYLNPIIQTPNEHIYIDQGHGTFMSGQIVQTPGGPVMLVQSPNQRITVDQAQLQQPTMIVYPNAFLGYDGQEEPPRISPQYNHQIPQQISPPMYPGEMVASNAQWQSNQNQRFSPRFSPSNKNVSPKLSPSNRNASPKLSPSNRNLSPRLSPLSRNIQSASYLQNPTVPLQMGQIPQQHLPSSETGYLVPNESQMIPNFSTVPRHQYNPNSFQNIQHFPAQHDANYLNPLNNTSNQMAPKLIASPDYINSQKEPNPHTLKSVPDVVLHSSSEMEEEVII